MRHRMPKDLPISEPKYLRALFTLLPALLISYACTGIQPRATSFSTIGNVNTDQRIRLRASIPLPDDGELGLLSTVPEPRISLNGSAPAKVVSIKARLKGGIYGAGQAIAVALQLTSPVQVLGQPRLVLSSGCYYSTCSRQEIQSFTCQAENGAFAVKLQIPPTARTAAPPDGGPPWQITRVPEAGTVSTVVNIPANASRQQLEQSLVSLALIDKVTVTYSNSRPIDRYYGPRVCTSQGNVVNITFERTSLFGTDGDIPLLSFDPLNAPLDFRLYQSQGDGSFLSNRPSSYKVGITNTVELQKGKKLDDGLATYVRGNGSTMLDFVYVTRDGEQTGPLDVLAFDFRDGVIVKADTGELLDLSSLPLPRQSASIFYSSADSLASSSSIIVNSTSACVIDVTTSNPDGTYTTGDIIGVIVDFSASVNLTFDPLSGTAPYVLLNAGGVEVKAYASRRSSGSLVYFDYTIQEGDSATGLDYYSSTSLVVGRGHISSASTYSNTSASTLLPSPGSPGSISSNRDINIDTRRPQVKNVSSPLPSGTYGAGQIVPISVSFDHNVSVGGRPYILLATSNQTLATGVISVPSDATIDWQQIARTGQPAEIRLMFAINIDLEIGDVLQVAMPGFVHADLPGNNQSRSIGLGGSSGHFFFGDWVGNRPDARGEGAIDLVVVSAVPAGLHSVTVLATNGIVVPHYGVHYHTSAPISISFSGSRSRTNPVPMLLCPGVGILQSNLSLLPLEFARAGGSCEIIQLSVLLSGPLVQNDTLSLSLAPLGFDNMPDTNISQSMAVITPLSPFDATWYGLDNVVTMTYTRSNNGTLPLRRCPTDAAGGACYFYQIELNGSSGGATYPRAGLYKNDPRFTISTNAVALGQSAAIPITTSPAVGRFEMSSVSFHPAIPNTPTALQLRFMLCPGDLAVEDTITLSLPQTFSFINTSHLVLTPVNDAFSFAIGYVAAKRQLSLRVLEPLMARRLVNIQVDVSSGLVLPVDGLSLGRAADQINISCTSATVPVPSRPVEHQVYVGGFQSFSVEYPQPQLANASVALLIQFTLSTELEAKDSILLYLAGFTYQGMDTDGGHWVDISNRSSINVTGLVRQQSEAHDGTSSGPTVVLTLLPQQRLSVGQPVSVLVQSSEQICLPSAGLLENDCSLMVAIQGKRTRMDAVCVPSSPCVGLCTSALSYSTRLAGSEVTLSLTFSLSVIIHAGDAIRLFLPTFGGFTSTLGLTLTTGNNASQHFKGQWDTSMQYLTLLNHYSMPIPARTNFSFAVHGNGGPTGQIRLSPYGMAANDPALTIATNATDLFASSTGFATERSIQSSPSTFQTVAILYSHIAYVTQQSLGGLIAGGCLSAINVSLALDAALQAGDRLTLTLPGLLQPSTKAVDIAYVQPETLSISCRPYTAAQQLVVEVISAQEVWFGTSTSPYTYNFTLWTSEACLLVVPRSGLLRNDPSLTVAGQLQHGLFPTQSIQHSSLVPGILHSQIMYSPITLASAITLDLILQLNTVLQAGSTFRIALPLFRGVPTVESPVTIISSGVAPAVLSANWSTISGIQGPEVIVRVTSPTLVPIGAIGISFPISQGLYLPAAGHPANWSGIYLDIQDRAAGFHINTTIIQSPCVGICSSTLQFYSPKFGYTSALTLSWQSNPRLQANDTLCLWLPHFELSGSAVGSSSIALDYPSTQIFTAECCTYPQSVLALCFTARRNLSANATIHVARRSLVLLPTSPLTTNDPSFRLNATITTLGSTAPRSVDSTAPVGVLYQSNMTYTNPIAGLATGLTLIYSSSSRVGPGDRIEIALPGFTATHSDFSQVDVLSMPCGQLTVQAGWNSGESYLSITIVDGIFLSGVNESVRIIIPSTSGLRLPRQGLHQDDSALLLSTTSYAGPIASVSIKHSPAVGAMLLSYMGFSPPWPNATANITLAMVFSGQIEAGDKIWIRLPSFSCRGFASGWHVLPLQISGASSMQASFYAQNASLLLVATSTLAAGTIYQATILNSSHLRLPAHGIYLNDPGITISVRAAACPITVAVPIDRVDPVGLITSKLSFPCQAKSGEPAPLRLDVLLSTSLGSALCAGQVQLQLPGFAGPDSNFAISNASIRALNTSFLSISSPAALFDAPVSSISTLSVNCTWSNQSQTLTFRLPRSIVVAAKSVLTLSVPPECSLKLPTLGLAAHGHMIALTVSGLGTSPWWNLSALGVWPGYLAGGVRFVQPVGAFLYSSLSFQPTTYAVSGNITSLTFNFTLSGSLGPNETVTLVLPDFTWDPSWVSLSTLSETTLNASTQPPDSIRVKAEASSAPAGILIHLLSLVHLPPEPIIIHISALHGIRLPARGIAVREVAAQPFIYTDAADAPVPYPGQPVRNVQTVSHLSNTTISFISTDQDSVVFRGGNRSVIRVSPGLLEQLGPGGLSSGEELLIGRQIMTLDAVYGLELIMREQYGGAGIHDGRPTVTISTPGFRPAIYSAGSGGKVLTFLYHVQFMDYSAHLELWNGSLLYTNSAVDWIRRDSMHPVTSVLTYLPQPGSLRCLSYNRRLVIDTAVPYVLSVFFMAPNGTYALGDIINVGISFSTPVVVSTSQPNAELRLPLLRLGIATVDGSERFATYESTIGQSTLCFKYSVQLGDQSVFLMQDRVPSKLDYFDYDLASCDASPLRTIYGALSSYIRQASTSPTTEANLTLPYPGQTGSLSATTCIIVDSQAPRVIRLRAEVNQLNSAIVDLEQSRVVVGAGDFIDVLLTYTSAVTVDTQHGAPYLLLSTNRPATLVPPTSNQTRLRFRYLVQDGDCTHGIPLEIACPDSTCAAPVYINLNGSSIHNSSIRLPTRASVGSLSNTDGLKVIIDTSPPSVVQISVANQSKAALLGPGESIVIVVQFTSLVEVVGVPILQLAIGESNCFAEYVTGSQTSTLLFRYRTKLWYGTADLDYSGVEALHLNGGSIRRFSRYPSTDANLTLPLPGHKGSLGFSNDIVVDPEPPYVKQVTAPARLIAQGSQTVALCTDCEGGNHSVAFRLGYGDLRTRCFHACQDVNISSLSNALIKMFDLTPELLTSVSQAEGIVAGAAYYISITRYPDLGSEGGDILARAATKPLQILPCADMTMWTGTSGLAQWWPDWTGVPALPRLISAGADVPLGQSVFDLNVAYSAPIVIEGNPPYIELQVGAASARGYYTPGRRTQTIDVGIAARSQVRAGAFRLKYGRETTGCVSWNVSVGLRKDALESRLRELWGIKGIGLNDVSGGPIGNGWRFEVEFAGPDPLPLQVDAAEPACQPFDPDDAHALMTRTSNLTFRYRPRASSRAILTVKESVNADASHNLSLWFSSIERIKWPKAGHMSEDYSLGIGVMSVTAPLQGARIPIKHLPAFLTSSLTFALVPQPCQSANVVLVWQLNINITMGDTLHIVLPHFQWTGPSAQVSFTGIGYSSEFNVTWQNQLQALQLTALAPTPAYQVAQIEVDSGLIIPCWGILRDDADYVITYTPGNAHTTERSIIHSPLAYVQPVGVAAAALSYVPRIAGTPTDITLTFETTCDLQPGDRVYLHLPGFTAPPLIDRLVALADWAAAGIPNWMINTHGFNATTLYLSGAISEGLSADWFSNNSTIIFTSFSRLPAGAVQNVTVLARNKIALPAAGLAPNSPDLSIRLSSSHLGNMTFVSIPVSDAIGAFRFSSVNLDPLVPGAVTTINITFQHGAAIQGLEYVNITLPGFRGCSNGSLALSGRDWWRFQGYWLQDEGCVSLISRYLIAEYTQVQVSVTHENLLRLPSTGIAVFSSISTNASQGPVTPTPVNASTLLGYFLHSEISFSSLRTTSNVSISLKLRFNSAVQPGNAFALVLGDMSANITQSAGNSSQLIITGPYTNHVRGDIHALGSNGTRIVIWSLTRFDPGALLELRLACRGGLYLPLRGLREGDPSITIWANSTVATMPAPQPVDISPAFGLYGTMLSYAPLIVGQPVDVYFVFSSSGILSKGDLIQIHLPNYSFPPSMGTISFQPKGTDGDFFLGTLTSSLSLLSFTVLADLAPVARQLVVPAVVGICLPFNGTLQNSPSLTLDIDTMSMGKLRSIPIYESPPVGALLAGSLDYSRVAGQSTSITLTYLLTTRVDSGQRVSITLPGFSVGSYVVQNMACVDRHTGNVSTVVQADWLEGRQTLIVTYLASVGAAVNMSLILPADSGMNLPPAGVNATHSFVLSSTAASGPIQASPITAFPLVGAMQNTSLTFSPANSSVPLRVQQPFMATLQFALSMLLLGNDSVSLFLPGVSRLLHAGNGTISMSSESILDTLPGERDLLAAYWTEASSTFHLQAKRRLPTGLYTVKLGAHDWLRLPSNGYIENDPSILLSVSAAAGPVLPAPLFSIGAIGISAVSLIVQPPVSGVRIQDMALIFVLSGDLVKGDSLYLWLGGFTKATMGLNVSITGAQQRQFQASWNATGQTPSLLLCTQAHIRAGTPVELHLNISSGLQTPQTGIHSRAQAALGVAALSLAINRTSTVVQPILNVSRFGTLSPSSLEILPASSAAGQVATLRLNFTTVCDMGPGDAIVWTLPGFGGPSTQNLALEYQAINPFRGSWDACAQLLTLTVRSASYTHTRHFSVLIEADGGLTLPILGLLQNDSRLLIHSNATLCPVLAQQLSSASGIPAIVSSSLTYFPSTLIDDATLNISFKLTFGLRIADNATLWLPGFRGPSNQSLAISGAYAPVLVASWSNRTEHLTLRLTTGIPANTPIHVQVQSVNGLRLPTSGLKNCDSSLQISIACRACLNPIQNTGIHVSPQVGIVASALSYQPALAGQAAALTLTIDLTFALTVGANILLELPGFSGPSEFSLLLAGPRADDDFASGFTGSWSNVTQTLVLVATREWPATLPLSLTVIRSNGLRLPIAGIPSTANFQLTISEPNFGNISEALTDFPPIGALLRSSASFDNSLPGATSAITLNLTLSGNLSAGDQLVLDFDTFTRECFQPLSMGGPQARLFSAEWLPPDYGELRIKPGSSKIKENGGKILRAATSPMLLAALDLPAQAVDSSKPGLSQTLAVAFVDSRQAPFVLSILSPSSPPAPYVHYAGSFIILNVLFSDPIAVLGSGIPYLRLAATADETQTPAAARYIAGNLTDTFSFLYQVVAADNTPDLSCFDTRSLVVPADTSLVLAEPVISPVRSIVHANASLTGVPCFLLARSSGIPKPILISGSGLVSVSDVYTDKSNGTYGAGEVVDIFVKYSFPVIVNGFPLLLLNVSQAINVSAEYQGFANPLSSFSNALIFRYQVGLHDMTQRLDFLSTWALYVPPTASILVATQHPSLHAGRRLPAPGSESSLSGHSHITIDTSPPEITWLSALESPGIYAKGTSLSIALCFSWPVVVTERPTLALNVGRLAMYASGSGTTTLIFRYTVDAPDQIFRLNHAGPHALQLSEGSSILRASTHPTTLANLTIPQVMNTSLIPYNLTIDYRGAARVLRVWSTLPDGMYSIGQVIPVLVAFSSKVTLTGIAKLMLDSGNVHDGSAAAYQGMYDDYTLNFSYTAQDGDNTSCLSLSSHNSLQLVNEPLANASLVDSYGNIVVLTMFPAVPDPRALNYSSHIAIRSDPPRVLQLYTSLPNGLYGIGQDIDFSVRFSRPVVVRGFPYIRIQTFYRREDAKAMYTGGSGTDTLTFVYRTRGQDWAAGLPADKAQLVDYDGVSALAISVAKDRVDNANMSSYDPPAILAKSTLPSQPAALYLPAQDQSPFDGSQRGEYRIIVDAAVPRISSIQWLCNGTFGAGDVLLLRVNFTLPVVLYGTPTLLLNTSDNYEARQSATYTSGNGSASILYRYLVQEGDAADPLDYVDTRLAPYNVLASFSMALLTTDRDLGDRQLPENPSMLALGTSTYLRQSTVPTTLTDVSIPLPGRPNSLGSVDRPVRIDTRPPTVLQVTTELPDATYGVGFLISIQIIFSAPVIVFGTPILMLQVGVDNRFATYTTGNLTSRLIFEYIIHAGDNCLALDYVATDSLILTGGSLAVTDQEQASAIKRYTDNPTTDADLTLPPPGLPATIMSPKSIVGSGHLICVAASGYIVSKVLLAMPRGSYSAGQELPILVYFTDQATITAGSPCLLMDMSVGSQAFYVSGNGSRILSFIYKVQKGDDTDIISYRNQFSFDLHPGSMSSGASGSTAVVILPEPGKPGSLQVESSGVSISTSTIRVMNVRIANLVYTRYGVGDVVQIDINFSGPVSLISGTPHLLLRTQGGRTGIAPCRQGSGGSLSCGMIVMEGMHTSVLNYYDTNSLVLNQVSLLRSATVPTVGVDSTLPCVDSKGSIVGTSGFIHIDDSPAQVLSINSVVRPGVYVAGNVIEMSLHWSWNVSVSGVPLLQLNLGLNKCAAYKSGAGSSHLTFAYRVEADDSIAGLEVANPAALLTYPGTAVYRLSNMAERYAASLALPVPGSEYSLGRQTHIVIDNSAPRILALSTSMDDGTYGPGTVIELYATFSDSVTVLPTQGIPWRDRASVSTLQTMLPVLYMKIGKQLILPAASWVNDTDGSRVMHFIQLLPDSLLTTGQLSVADESALDCGLSEISCIFSIGLVPAALTVPSNLHLTFDVNVAEAPDNHSADPLAGNLSLSTIIYDPDVPLIKDVSCLTPFSPKYGLGPGDIIEIKVTFSCPVSAMTGDGSQQPALVLNLHSAHSSALIKPPVVAALKYATTRSLVFSYMIRKGECTEALDYLDSRSLLGVVRPSSGAVISNMSSFNLTLPRPGTRGSISYKTKIFVSCSAPAVVGLIPLKRPGTYVQGELIYIVARFSLPVSVITLGSHVPPRLYLDLQTGPALHNRAIYDPNASSALEGTAFDLLPTDLLFRYDVSASDLTGQVMQAGTHALHTANSTWIVWSTPALNHSAALTLIDPAVNDVADAVGWGRWLGSYSTRIDILLRGLAHEDAADLRISLIHGNVSVLIINATSPAGKSFGSQFQTAPFKTPHPWQWHKRDRLYADAAMLKTEPVETMADDIGYDYYLTDLPGDNFARQGIASQSSTMQGRVASLAIDGNIDGRFSKGSTIYAGPKGNGTAWWQVSFNDAKQGFGTLRIWNTVDEPLDPAGLVHTERLHPCYVMILPASVGNPVDITDLQYALQLAVWSQYLVPQGEQITTLTLPSQVRGKHVRLQLENVGFLAFAELQAFKARSCLVRDYEGGARIAQYITQPFQPEEPMWECLHAYPVTGSWTLQIEDRAASEPIGTGKDGYAARRGGTGIIDEYVLMLTDFAGQVSVYHVDIMASIETLPKFGSLFLESSRPSDVWLGEETGRLDLSGEILRAATFRVISQCDSEDVAQAQCYPRAPANTSILAAFNLIDNDRIIYYTPNPGYRGSDMFTYRITGGDNISQPGQVILQTRNCSRASPHEMHPLCQCHPLFPQEQCIIAVANVCANPGQSSLLSRLCDVCYNGLSLDCKVEVQLAVVLLSYRGMCTASGYDCQTATISTTYNREAYLPVGVRWPEDLPATNTLGDLGSGFMWSAHV